MSERREDLAGDQRELGSLVAEADQVVELQAERIEQPTQGPQDLALIVGQVVGHALDQPSLLVEALRKRRLQVPQRVPPSPDAGVRSGRGLDDRDDLLDPLQVLALEHGTQTLGSHEGSSSSLTRLTRRITVRW